MPNPALEDWEATDQQVLSYLLNSLSKDTLAGCYMCNGGRSMEDHRRHVRVTDTGKNREHTDCIGDYPKREFVRRGVLRQDEGPRRRDENDRKAARR